MVGVGASLSKEGAQFDTNTIFVSLLNLSHSVITESTFSAGGFPLNKWTKQKKTGEILSVHCWNNNDGRKSRQCVPLVYF